MNIFAAIALRPSLLLLVATSLCTAASLEQSIDQLKRVGPEGKGNAQASQSWKDVAAAGGESIPLLLRSMEGANDLAANWIRTAIESIAQRERSSGKTLPLQELGAFLLEVRNDPKARSLAFELLSSADATLSAQLLSGMRNDPSLDLRRGAVQQIIAQGSAFQQTSNRIAAGLLFQQALSHARDIDQIEALTSNLKELGQKPDLAALFGWVRHWKVIGPFDNTKRNGFETVYAPENGVALDAEMTGKSGPVRWVDLKSTDEYGKIDVNLPLGKLKESIAYCYTELEVEKPQTIELRLGCKNAWKVWLNGKYLFGRDEYHRGAEIDQYRLAGELKPGKNAVLIKLGQNEQTEEWTVEWEFQLRVTDALGTPIAPLKAGLGTRGTASLHTP